MSNILGIIIGALIALLGTGLTGYLSFKGINKNIESNISIEESKLDSQERLVDKQFNNDIIKNNRDFLPKAGQTIIHSMNQLYDKTQVMVMNYPGILRTGRKPDLLFRNTIDNLSSGFPNSFEELKSIDEDWRKSYKGFENIISENNIFITSELYQELIGFSKVSYDIKSYFYGFYGDVSDKQELLSAINKFNKIYPDGELITSEKANQYYVLNYFEDLENRKKEIIKNLGNYMKDATNIV